MKRLAVRECLSQRFLKVLEEDYPGLTPDYSVFAVFRALPTRNLCGLVTSYDIALHPDWSFGDFFSKECPEPTLKINATVNQALALMKKEKKDLLPVLDAEGTMVGIVVYVALLEALYKRERVKVLKARAQSKREMLAYATIHKHETIQQLINQNVYPDSLTGLPQLSQIREKINMWLIYTQEKKAIGALLLVNLDDFRSVNDTMSNYYGDLILQQVSIRIASNLHKNDTLARRGGDEFAIILCDLETQDEASFMAKIILKALSSPFRIGDHDVYITASIGIALYSLGLPPDVEVLLLNADIALEQAKAMGKNNYQQFVPVMGDRAKYQQQKEKHLRLALEHDELFVCYQPQIEIKNNNIVGMEALLRWNNPELGLVMPNDFISLAENSGLIVAFGDWVLQTACKQAKSWQRDKHSLRVAVNLSVRQFQGIFSQSTNKFIRNIEAMLDETGLPPELLEMEITESVIMRNYAASMVTLKKLKNLGVRISCDDFGTGYSALNYIKQFPMDTIKIDKSFIDDIATNPVDVAIIRAIIVMARQLKIEVIAEGVETKQQLDILCELGCDMAQGYYFSKPLSIEDVTALLDVGFSI